MVLVDTSAWVEFLRGSNTPVRLRLRDLISARSLATTEAVVMELLAGVRSRCEEREIRRLLAIATLVSVENLHSWERAGTIFRACRAAGATVRSQLDCLIAAVAIREDVPVLHADRDFDLIAKHTPLRLVATG